MLSTAKQLADSAVSLLRDSQNVNLTDKDAVAKMIALSNQAQEDVGILLGELSSGADLPQDLDRESNRYTYFFLFVSFAFSFYFLHASFLSKLFSLIYLCTSFF